MFDIHTHVLPLVDDGSGSVETSLNMLRFMVEDGVTDVVLTPHYRGKYNKTARELTSLFNQFKKQVLDAGINVNLYVGQEVFRTEDLIDLVESKEVLTLNDTNYVLVEFPYHERIDVEEIVYDIVASGYTPVIAHIERYGYLSIDDVVAIKSFGALIQVNATAVLGDAPKYANKMVKKLLKAGLVDFVASDAHENRQPNLKDAHTLVKKKYGENYANALFTENAKKILSK